MILTLATLVGGLTFVILQKTLPNDDAKVTLAGLGGSVGTVFDKEGVPHISAMSYDDAVRSLGFLHARDRLWQMEVLRMAGQGRLSEMFGSATLGTDRFLRTLGMAPASQASFEQLMPETQRAVEAYVAGINAYIERETGMMEPALGAEFLILGHSPERWEAWQSVLVIKVMGLTLSSNMDKEIKRFALAMKGFTGDEIDQLMPYGPRDNPPELPNLIELYGLKLDEEEAASILPDRSDKPSLFDLSLPWPTGQTASNNWVVSGKRTDTGKPILANDPHLGFTAPSTFYLAHLSWKQGEESRDVIGGTIPGVPFVVVGRTNTVGWGLTTTNHDAQDLFLEKLDTTNGTYLSPEGWQTLETREVEIRHGKEGVEKLTIQKTANGPLLPRSSKGLDGYLPETHGLALRWTGLASDDTTLNTLFLNNRAQSVSEFIEAGKHTVSPMQSIVVADTDGNIALTAHARAPKRQFANSVQGRAPVPGWDAKYQWDGFLETGELLTILNPSEEALTTANANFLPSEYQQHITFDWAEHYRQARAEQLIINDTNKHSVETSISIMGDTISPAMIRFRNVAQRVIPDGVGVYSEIRSALKKWDGRMEADRPEPLIMLAWFRHLNIAMLKDDLDGLFEHFERGRITRLIGMLERGTARDWCDNRLTAETEDCSEILVSSFKAAIEELSAEQGSDWLRWNYGEAHVAYSEHRPFGQVKPLARFFNIETPSSGGPYTLLRGQTKFQEEKPYRSRHGSAYRAVYDFSDLDQSLFIQSTGQSGNVMSPQYDSLAKRWAKMEFISMTTKREAYSKDALGVWTFNP